MQSQNANDTTHLALFAFRILNFETPIVNSHPTGSKMRISSSGGQGHFLIESRTRLSPGTRGEVAIEAEKCASTVDRSRR